MSILKRISSGQIGPAQPGPAAGDDLTRRLTTRIQEELSPMVSGFESENRRMPTHDETREMISGLLDSALAEMHIVL